MLRRRSLAMMPVALTLVSALTATPALAEPFPPDLPRFAGVPVELFEDENGDGVYDLPDFVNVDTTDSTGEWILWLPTKKSYLVVIRVGDLGVGHRIGGDLHHYVANGFSPYNGVPAKRIWDTAGPDGLFQLLIDFHDPIEDQFTRPVGPHTGGDFRFEQAPQYVSDSAVVLYIPASPEPNRGLRGWLWDATNDDN